MDRATVIVGAAMFGAMFGSNLPAPLYELYRLRFGFSTFAMTAVFAAYPLALVVTLVALARLPDRIGRRPVLAIGIAAAAAGSLCFLFATSIWWLFAGRLAAAVAIGAAGAAGPPALVELNGRGDRRQAAFIAAVAFSFACGAAPLLAGSVTTILGTPAAAYVAYLVACVAIGLALVFVPETRPTVAQRAAARRVSVRLDAAGRRNFTIAVLTSGIVWWLASLFVSLIPSYVASLLGIHNLALQGGLAFAMFGVSPIAQTLLRDADEGRSVRLGLLATLLAIAGILAAVPLRSIPLFAVATVVAGIAQGAGFFGAQTMVNRLGAPAERATLSARFYAFTYLMIGVPVMAIGALTTHFGLFTAFLTIGSLAAATAVGTLIAISRYRSHAPA